MIGLDFATSWGATHQTTDLKGPVHWIHWAGPADAGERDPFVLVHGLGGSVANWLDVGAIWSAEREVFALDLRGFGLTPGFPSETKVLANRDLVVAFLEHVVGRPAVLMGNSMGGMIATFVERARPDLLTRLVLIDPALPPEPTVLPDPTVLTRFALMAVPGVAERAMRRVRETSRPEDVVLDLAGLVYADVSRYNPQLLQANVDIATERGRGAGGAYGDLERSFTGAARSLLRIMARRGRYADHLARVSTPVLLLHGDRDRLVHVAAARRLARANPSWDYVEFAGVGHAPQMELPEETARAVTGWVAREPVAA